MTLVNGGYLGGADDNAPTNTANLISRMVDFYINVTIANISDEWYGIDAAQATSDTILEYALDLTLAQTAQLSNGETPSVVLSDNLRVTAHKDLQSDLEGFALEAPLTAEESSAGVVPQKMTFPTNGLQRCSSNDYASFGVTLWTVSPFSNISGTDTLGSQVMQMHVPTADQTDSNLASAGNGEWNITIQYDSDQPFDIDIYDRVFPAVYNFDGTSFSAVPAWACNTTSFTKTSATFACADIGSMCGWDISSLDPWASSRRLQTSVSSGGTTSTIMAGGFQVVPGSTQNPTGFPTTQPTKVGQAPTPSGQPTAQPSGTEQPSLYPTAQPSPSGVVDLYEVILPITHSINYIGTLTDDDTRKILVTAEEIILPTSQVRRRKLRTRRLASDIEVKCLEIIVSPENVNKKNLEYKCVLKHVPDYKKEKVADSAIDNLEASVKTGGGFETNLNDNGLDATVNDDMAIAQPIYLSETKAKDDNMMTIIVGGVGVFILCTALYFFYRNPQLVPCITSKHTVNGNNNQKSVFGDATTVFQMNDIKANHKKNSMSSENSKNRMSKTSSGDKISQFQRYKNHWNKHNPDSRKSDTEIYEDYQNGKMRARCKAKERSNSISNTNTNTNTNNSSIFSSINRPASMLSITPSRAEKLGQHTLAQHSSPSDGLKKNRSPIADILDNISASSPGVSSNNSAVSYTPKLQSNMSSKLGQSRSDLGMRSSVVKSTKISRPDHTSNTPTDNFTSGDFYKGKGRPLTSPHVGGDASNIAMMSNPSKKTLSLHRSISSGKSPEGLSKTYSKKMPVVGETYAPRRSSLPSSMGIPPTGDSIIRGPKRRPDKVPAVSNITTPSTDQRVARNSIAVSRSDPPPPPPAL
jgi:hypothetical protein